MVKKPSFHKLNLSNNFCKAVIFRRRNTFAAYGLWLGPLPYFLFMVFMSMLLITRRISTPQPTNPSLASASHGSPQISSAICLTSASFFFSSSRLSGYPVSCVLNPHCGDTLTLFKASSLVCPDPSAIASAAL